MKESDGFAMWVGEKRPYRRLLRLPSQLKKCNLCAALVNMRPAECLRNYVLV